MNRNINDKISQSDSIQSKTQSKSSKQEGVDSGANKQQQESSFMKNIKFEKARSIEGPAKKMKNRGIQSNANEAQKRVIKRVRMPDGTVVKKVLKVRSNTDKILTTKSEGVLVNSINDINHEQQIKADNSFDENRYGSNLGLMVNFAKISGVHGVRGAFSAKCYFDNPEEYVKSNIVYFYDKKIKLRIEGQKQNGEVIFSSPLIDSPQKAQSMNGKFLKCLKTDIPRPQESHLFTVAHLIGLKVYYSGSSKCIGYVNDVVTIAGNILLEIVMEDEIANTKKTEFIVFDTDNINEIKIDDGLIIINKKEFIMG